MSLEQAIARGQVEPISTQQYLAETLERSQREARPLNSRQDRLAQLIVGGEWSATLTIVNLGTANTPVIPVFFLDNKGAAFPVRISGDLAEPTTAPSLMYTLIPGATLQFNLESPDAETHFGHVFLPTFNCDNLDCIIYGEIVLKNSNESRPDFESVFSLEDGAASQSMLWDHRGGFYTVLYIVNAGIFDTTAQLQVFDEFGDLITGVDDLSLAVGAAAIVQLHAERPETLNHYGHLRIDAAAPNHELLVTSLRVNPSNSFTPVGSVAVGP